MSDNRPFAKIDVGYHWNQKWFQVERIMRNAMPNALPIALRNTVRTARNAHHASILYCRTHATDGVFPVQAIKMTCAIFDPEEDATLTALFEVGLWVNHPGGMAEVRDYLKHQTDSDTTKNRSEAARKAANARWAKHAERNADAYADRNAEKRREEERREEVVNTPTPLSRFAEFYAAYPRRMKRGDAEKAYAAALKRASADDITSGAQRLATDPNLPDKKYIPYPATWLRADRWADEPLPPQNGTSPNRSTTDDRVAGWMNLAQQTKQPETGRLEITQ